MNWISKVWTDKKCQRSCSRGRGKRRKNRVVERNGVRAEQNCTAPILWCPPRETTPAIQSYFSFPLSHVLNTSDPIFLEKDLKNSLGTKSKHSWEPGDILGISLMNFTWIPLLIGGNFHPSVMRNFQCCKVSLGLSFSRTNCISLCSAGPYLQERTSYYPYHI